LPKLLFTLGLDIKMCHSGTVYELSLSLFHPAKSSIWQLTRCPHKIRDFVGYKLFRQGERESQGEILRPDKSGLAITPLLDGYLTFAVPLIKLTTLFTSPYSGKLCGWGRWYTRYRQS